MRTAPSFCLLITAVVVNVSCRGVLGPSCTDESGGVLRTEGVLQMGGTSSHAVVSPKSSNLLIRLTWTDIEATLGVSATITDCGGHTGCAMATTTPLPGPGGSSPVPLPWPAGSGRCWWMAGAVRRTASISPETQPEMRLLRWR